MGITVREPKNELKQEVVEKEGSKSVSVFLCWVCHTYSAKCSPQWYRGMVPSVTLELPATPEIGKIQIPDQVL